MRPLRPTALALAAALTAGLVQGAAAQDLRTLYESARSYDATYLAARAQAESTEYRVKQAEALDRPNAGLSAAANAAYLDQPTRSAGSSNTVQGSLNARMPLYNRENDVTIEQAQKSLAVSQADLDAAEQDLIVRLAQAYFDVLAAEDTLAAAQAGLKAITEQLASAKRNFEVGTATITDTREAQARFDLGTAVVIQAENTLRTRRIALDQLVGRPGVEPKPLIKPTDLPAVLPADPEAWVGTADAQHPSILRARAALEVAQLEIERAKASDGPTLDAVASVGGADYSGRYPQSIPGFSRTASIGLQFNLPLYTGGLTDSRVKETVLLEEKARNDLAAARRGVAQATRVAYFGVQSGSAQVKALEAAESSSQLALEATELSYKVGVRVNLDVLNAQTQLFQTQRDLARARYDVLVGYLLLRQASGQLSESDLDVVNRLLVP